MAEKRILLMYISEVSGHHQATKAIEDALRILDPQVNILNINGFGYTNPLSEKIVNSLYMGIIKRAPFIWNYLYDNPKIIKSTQRYKSFLHSLNSPKLKDLYDEFRPQVIACSQAFPCGMVADFKKTYNIDVRLVGIVTDYTAHSFWIYPTVDFYVVPDDTVKERLIEKGVSPKCIKVFGIPISPKFNENPNKEEILKKLGLDSSSPVILIMGGGQGLGPIKRIIKYLDRVKNDIQIVVITGKNKKLLRDLEKRKPFYKKKLVVLGFIDNVHEVMAISDLLITKPGGITTAEALTKGLPMIIVKPIPGQEFSNTSYLVKNGTAIKIEKEKEILPLIERLLMNPKIIRDMRAKALEIARPNSSFDIARLLLSLCEPH
jgi:processive 1,2-diacylglycerol beta-glucosyltransferase